MKNLVPLKTPLLLFFLFIGLNAFAQLPVFNITSTPAVCKGSNTGQIEFNIISGPPAGYTLYYSIDNGLNFVTNPIFPNLIGGPYTCILRSSAPWWTANSTPQVITVGEPANGLSATAGLLKLAGCGHSGEGTIRVTNVQGATGTVEYSFDGGTNWTTNPQADRMPGTYSVFIRDTSGCGSYSLGDITIDPTPVAPTVTPGVIDYNCDGTANTNVTITPNSADPLNYTYYLDGEVNPNISDPTSFLNIPNGSHTITVDYMLENTDYSTLLVEDFGSGANTTSPYISSDFCYENQLGSCGGTGISDGEYSVTSNIVNLLPQGSFGNLWVQADDHTSGGTDPNGRFLVVNFGFTVPIGAVIYEQPINDITPNQPLEIQLSAFNILNPITDSPPMSTWPANGHGYINSDIRISLVDASNNEIAFFSTGDIPKDMSWHDYSFTLDPGANTSLRFVITSNIPPLHTDGSNVDGNEVAIDDITVYQKPESCNQQIDIPFTVDPGKAFTASISSTDIVCSGAGGEIIITAGNFNTNYQYSTDGGANWSTTSITSLTIPGFPTGIHNIHVRYDATSTCLVTSSQNIGGVSTITATAGVSELAGCGTSGEGKIRVSNIQGGTAPYLFSYDNQTTWITDSELYVNPGTYTIYIKDASNCPFALQPVTLDPAPAPTVTIEPLNYNCDGTATVNVNTLNNGTEPLNLTYYLDGTENTNITNPNIFLNVSEGAHTVKVAYQIDTANYSELLVETFGSGANTTSPYISGDFCYENQLGSCGGTNIISDGEYSVTSNIVNLINSPAGNLWVPVSDHTIIKSPTAAANGRFLVVNFGFSVPVGAVIYEQQINDIIPNQPIEIELSAFNILNSITDASPIKDWPANGYGYVNSDMRISLVDASNNEIAWFSTGGIPKDISWHDYSFTLDPGNNTSLQFVITSNVPPIHPDGSNVEGNEVAIDDITITQKPIACIQEIEQPFTVDALPTVTLSNTIGNTCGVTPITIPSNTFGGSATSVTISHNGAGNLTSITENITPFDIIYTPDTTDAGNNITITVTTDDPLGNPCTVANATYTLQVNPVATPTFNAVPAICAGDVLTALPTTSLESITGTWSPALDNTATTTYTFTPDAGQCATTETLTIAVNPLATPTFNPVPAICAGDVLTTLPTTSLEGITGTWSPALNNTATTTYTFTPDIDPCAPTATLTITVNPVVTPTFNTVPSICSEDALTALPTTSLEGITGTWSPALDNTTTTTYTFAPDVDPCAATATLTITVNPILTPPITSVDCAGGSGSATIIISSPTGADVEYSLNGGVYQPAPNFTGLADGGYTITARNTVTDCVSLIANETVDCSCPNSPTLNLNVSSDSTCIDSPITITTNTFGGSATRVELTHNGAGSLNSTTETSNPFSFTYNPVAADGGNSVTITVTTDNPLGVLCLPVSKTFTLMVDTETVPTFTAVAPICSGESLLPLPIISNNGITGTWSPALDNTSTTTYTFNPATGECATAQTLTVTVNAIVTPTFSPIPPICAGDTLGALPTTSIEGITGTWSPALDNTTTTNYTFTPDVNPCAPSANLTITVNPNIAPTFDPVNPICIGSPLSPLPTTSNNSITGTWSPALDNTTTTTYTFTPDNPSQCGDPTTLTILVDSEITPTFDPVSPICDGDALAPLPTTSNNGITGTWSPVLDNTTTTTYTFTPDNPSQCGVATTLTITVNPLPSVPVTSVDCSGGSGDSTIIISSPTGADIEYSLNGGTYQPIPSFTGLADGAYTITARNTLTGCVSIISNETVNCSCPNSPTLTLNASSDSICVDSAITITTNTFGGSATRVELTHNGAGNLSSTTETSSPFSFTYNPVAADGGNSVTITVTTNNPLGVLCYPVSKTFTLAVEAQNIPTFDPIEPICSGESLLPLPTTSNNGITGTWSPALDNTETTTYTFNPAATECANTQILTITVNPVVTPTFNAVPTICEGDALSALPTTSLEGITGIWEPALDNTKTTTYTFTPDVNLCAPKANLTIIVAPLITPTFNPLSTICIGDTSPLSTVSIEGITGTWAPIFSSSIEGTTPYTFTPNPGQCAASGIALDVTVSIITPTFNPLSAICIDAPSPLSSISNEGITGTWAPAFDSTTAGTTPYTFTPDPGQCSATNTLAVTVILVTPTFNPLSDICPEDPSPLPSVSKEGINGTWSPFFDSSNIGTTSYTFIPDPGQCAASGIQLDVSVTIITPTFNPVTDICIGETSPLPSVSIEGITGIWSPVFDSSTTGTTTYTFTPNPGQCAALGVTLGVTTTVITPTFNTLPPICIGDTSPLPSASIEGITGTWSPVFDSSASRTYTFLPDSDQCAASGVSLGVTVDSLTVPVFNTVNPICEGDRSPLPTLSTNGISGTWSPLFDAYTSRNYTFTPVPGQCADTNTLAVTVIPKPIVSIEDNFLCENKYGFVVDPVFIDTYLNPSDYVFSWYKDGVLMTGETQEFIEVLDPGRYRVEATDLLGACAKATDNAYIEQYSFPEITAVLVTESFEENQTIRAVGAGGSGSYEYSLDDSEIWTTDSIFSNLPLGLHTIHIRDAKGCIGGVDSAFVIGYPKYFTPNQDGYNDYWTIYDPYLSNLIPNSIVSIYDRYGKLVKQLDPTTPNGWDGTFNGRLMPTTDYWFILEYDDYINDGNGERKTFKAHFALKR